MDTRPTRPVLRRARPDEGDLLRALTIASRRHWRHDVALFAAWEEGLEFPPEWLGPLEAYVAEVAAEPVGWVAVGAPVDGVSPLEELWVVPAWIGRGVGRALFRHAADRARALGARTLAWDAEPGAAGFYERMGARRVGERTSRSFGIPLPLMELDL